MALKLLRGRQGTETEQLEDRQGAEGQEEDSEPPLSQRATARVGVGGWGAPYGRICFGCSYCFYLFFSPEKLGIQVFMRLTFNSHLKSKMQLGERQPL